MIIDFLQLKLEKSEMHATLRVIRAFCQCESSEEYLQCPFTAWTKLEQLVEFLEHRVEGKPLQDDTISEIGRQVLKTIS
jgi:hypothetical protein